MRIRSTKPEFWSSITVQAIAPTLVYDGTFVDGRRLAPAATGTEYVYMLFDAKDELLYVGRSFRPADRFTKHHRKPWWGEVDGLALLKIQGCRCGCEALETRALTKKLEALAITRLSPRANIAGKVPA